MKKRWVVMRHREGKADNQVLVAGAHWTRFGAQIVADRMNAGNELNVLWGRSPKTRYYIKKEAR